MAEPRDKDEYLARYHANTKVDGYSTDVASHVPCPFCAAPEWAVWMPAAGIMPGDDRPNLDAQMGQERTCVECGRSGKMLVVRDASGVQAELVQTGGPDPPEWLSPPPRRV